MKTFHTHWFVWLSRSLAILFTAFISLFALDAFQPGKTWQVIALDFLIHLIPAFLLIRVLILYWSREWIIGIMLILLGITYQIIAFEHLDWVLIISGPLFLMGGFFLISWFIRVHKL